MQFHRRQLLKSAGTAVMLPAISRLTCAQAYPTRPVTIIVPFAPGGSTDAIGRILADRMQASLGQPAVVVNAGGAGGAIGVGRVGRAAPDGYTIDIGQWSTHVINGAVYHLDYDLVKDFEAVGLIASNPLLIVAKNALPADDLKSFVAWLKANPDKASQGIPDPGQHAVGVLFQKETGTRFQFIPYRGGAPAFQDLVAGRIDLLISQAVGALPQIRAGTVKAYAVMAKSRLASAPDIPTVDEAGVPGLYVSPWFGIFAPKGTPSTIITKLNAWLVDSLADPTVRSRLAALGLEIFPPDQQTPEILAAYQKADIEKWWPIIKEANIKGE